MTTQLRVSVFLSRRLFRPCSHASTYHCPDNRHIGTYSGKKAAVGPSWSHGNNSLTSHGLCTGKSLIGSPAGHYIRAHVLTNACVLPSLTCPPWGGVGQRRHFTRESLTYYFTPHFAPIHYAIRVLETVQDTTGLPWWATILVTTVMMRSLITLPLGVLSMQNMARLASLAPMMKEKSDILSMEVTYAKKLYKWDQKKAKIEYKVNWRRIVKETRVEHNCHPAKQFLVFMFQLPIWVSLSVALRNMSGSLAHLNTPVCLAAVHPEMAEQGLFWFSNLMVPDATLCLPILCAMLNLMNCEVMSLSTPESARTFYRKSVDYFFRFLSVLVLPISLYLPSCMVYYWTCSSLLGLIQNLAFKSPSLRRQMSIPKLPRETATPYADLIQAAKLRYSKPFRRKKHKENQDQSYFKK